MKPYSFFLLAIVGSILNTRSSAQNYPANTKYVVTTIATQFDHGDSVTQNVTLTYYDTAWAQIASNGSALPGKSSSNRSVVSEDNKRKHVTCSIDEKGDTVDKIVRVYDEHGNQTYYYQIRGQDTLNDQKRIYDQSHHNTELYNKKNGEYRLFMKFDYDSNDRMIRKRQYEVLTGNIISEDKHEFDPVTGKDDWYTKTAGGKFQLRMTTTPLSDSVSKAVFFQETSGFNYGIFLNREIGGYSIIEKFDTGSIERLEIYDKKGRKSATVYVTYITLQ